MEIRTSMVTCPNGHHYDSSRHAACPYCGAVGTGSISGTDMPGGTGNFTPTEAPGSAGGAGNFTPTEAPGSAGGAGNFTPTEAPGSAVNYGGDGGYNAAFGATIAPDPARGTPEPFGVPTTIGGERGEGEVSEPVVGWLICINGPARGTDYRLHAGYNYIGRESGDIRIRGDLQISRQNHAMVAYDSGAHLYYAGPYAGRNIIKVNNQAVLNAVEIKLYDIISIGTTKLMFVPLCSDRFSWEEQ